VRSSSGLGGRRAVTSPRGHPARSARLRSLARPDQPDAIDLALASTTCV
jgi:hypothetical protein